MKPLYFGCKKLDENEVNDDIKDDKDDSLQLNINEAFVKEYSSNSQVVDFVRAKFNNLSRLGAINLIKNLQSLVYNLDLRGHCQ